MYAKTGARHAGSATTTTQLTSIVPTKRSTCFVCDPRSDLVDRYCDACFAAFTAGIHRAQDANARLMTVGAA
jgi:hypothetical protein